MIFPLPKPAVADESRPKGRGFTPNISDKDGYSEFQMWDLMETFGSHVTFGGAILPFDTTILIDEKDIKESRGFSQGIGTK